MQKMRHAPVYFTIAQARFNPILALDSYVPTIQDLFRKEGFPDTQRASIATFNFNAVPGVEGNPQPPAVTQMTRYAFSTMNKTAGFILDHGSLAYQTVEYDMFKGFAATFMKGLRVIHDAVTLSYTDRIGLRYLDAVFPGKGEELSEYLDKAVLGLYGKVESTLVHSFSETRLRSEAANVTARIIIQDGRIGFPPDLQPIGLELAPRFQSMVGMHAILDTDGSQERRAAFDLEGIANRLSAIHAEVVASFRASVTSRAIEKWE